MRYMSQYVANKNVFSERLKLSLPTAGFLKLSGREFHRWIWVSQYQNVCILDFVGVKDDGGGASKWSYKQTFANLQSNSHPTNSVRALKHRLPYCQHFCFTVYRA